MLAAAGQEYSGAALRKQPMHKAIDKAWKQIKTGLTTKQEVTLASGHLVKRVAERGNGRPIEIEPGASILAGETVSGIKGARNPFAELTGEALAAIDCNQA